MAGPNLFVGRNGQGKTNLIESLAYLSTLGSHRVAVDHAMIRQGVDRAIIRARLEHGDRAILAEVQLNRSLPNRAQINRSVIKLRELPRYFSSVLFAPEDLALVRGDPSGRRRFLDELLVLRSPRLAAVMADYDRVVRQRNILLKSARGSGGHGDQIATLDIWDERLVELGSLLIEARTTLVAELAPEVALAYTAVAGEDHQAKLVNQLSILADSDADPGATPAALAKTDSALDTSVAETHGGITIISAAAAAVAFRDSLRRRRRSERERGITLVGPHRDDLLLQLNSLSARGYASHGESWSFALALKLASATLLRRDSSTGDPVLMLDDVFAELDEFRRARLATAVQDFEQVLITAAVLGDVPATLTGNTVHIERGTILPGAP